MVLDSRVDEGAQVSVDEVVFIVDNRSAEDILIRSKLANAVERLKARAADLEKGDRHQVLRADAGK